MKKRIVVGIFTVLPMSSFAGSDRSVYECFTDDRIISAELKETSKERYSAEVTFANKTFPETRTLECKAGSADWPPYHTFTCKESKPNAQSLLQLSIKYYGPNDIQAELYGWTSTGSEAAGKPIKFPCRFPWETENSNQSSERAK